MHNLFILAIIFSFSTITYSLPDHHPHENPPLENSDDQPWLQENFEKAKDRVHTWFESLKGLLKPSEPDTNPTIPKLEIEPPAPKIPKLEENVNKTPKEVPENHKLDVLYQKLGEMHENFEGRLKKLEENEEKSKNPWEQYKWRWNWKPENQGNMEKIEGKKPENVEKPVIKTTVEEKAKEKFEVVEQPIANQEQEKVENHAGNMGKVNILALGVALLAYIFMKL